MERDLTMKRWTWRVILVLRTIPVTQGQAALILTFILGILVASHAGETPPPVARIAFFADAALFGPMPPRYYQTFREGLRDLGWVEGQNLSVQFGEAKTFDERPEVIRALLRARPHVFVTNVPGMLAVGPRDRTPGGPIPGWTPVTDVPVIFVGASDPVAFGFVQSLAHPGGNITGLSYMGVDLNPKRLELLKDTLPRLRRVGVLVPGGHALRDRIVREIEAAAPFLGVELQLQEVSQYDPALTAKIDAALEAMITGQAEAILGLQGPHYFRERQRICDFALEHRLPGIFDVGEYAEAGCLMSYAASWADLFHRAAGYADKILKGTKPSDLPVEQPTKFALVINLKTAHALGLTIPPVLLFQADEVLK